LKLYDFSAYAHRRAERHAAEAVARVVATVEQPCSVVELKTKVNEWFRLHNEVLRQAHN
jgi:response regulator RpfG family c-di-GMP phosphodiesterase